MAHVSTAATDIASNNSLREAEGEKEVRCWCRGSMGCGARQASFCKCYYRVITSFSLWGLPTAMIFVRFEAILLGVYKFRIVMSSC